MPKSLKSESGHHRLEACRPSNRRHKLAQRRPDFLALLGSPPSAITALDTLYEPNAVFSQFLGSGSMMLVCFSLSFPCFVFSFLSFFVFVFFSFLSFFVIVIVIVIVIVFVFVFVFVLFSPFLFRFLFIFFLFFSFIFPIELSLTCVCVGIGTTCSI